MRFYLGALRMLNIATGYGKNTLSCSELKGEHAGEGFSSIRHILTPLWACKAKKCHFSRKFDLWPDQTRSNIDLGPKIICAIARSRRGASTGFFPQSSTTIRGRSPGGVVPTNPPPLTVRVMRNALTGRGLIRPCLKLLIVLETISKCHFAHLTVFYQYVPTHISLYDHPSPIIFPLLHPWCCALCSVQRCSHRLAHAWRCYASSNDAHLAFLVHHAHIRIFKWRQCHKTEINFNFNRRPFGPSPTSSLSWGHIVPPPPPYYLGNE